MSDLPTPDKPSTRRDASTERDDVTQRAAQEAIQPALDAEATLDLSQSRPRRIPSDAPAQMTVRENSDVRLASSGLHIRCPHCHNHVEFLEEHEQSDITCSTCGSIFSIVSPTVGTRHATALKMVGHFELITRVGIGSFGAVWKAYDPELDRTVAVKIPRRGQLDPMDEAQFLREARVTAQLRHPNIVSVHEIGREGDTLYIVSDLIRGVTLSEMLTVRKLSTQEILELCIKIASALQHAHEQGVIHRDLKPSNIMTDQQGEPHLTDFGLAKREVGEITMTADGQILGTPAYMSPEQAAGDAHHVDRRTDIYALGVVLFELLTGELPYRGSAQMQIQQKLAEEAPDPRTLNRLIARDLATICTKCIQRDPNRRYRSADRFSDDLSRFVRGEPIRARPISRVERAIRWAKRHPAAATIGALVTLLAVAGPLVALRIDELRHEAEDLVVQKDLLIKDRDKIIFNAGKDITALKLRGQRLQTQLGTWEGGADPSAIWPPYKILRPSEQLLERVVVDPAYVEQLLRMGIDREQQTLVHLAVGVAYEMLEDRDRALTHYDAAKELLVELTQKQTNQPRYAYALADCLLRISHLRFPDDPTGAVELHRLRQATLRQLAEDDDRLQLQAAWFDSELQLTVALGKKGGADSLHRADQIRRELLSRNPRSPRELYELACFLSERPPLLIDTN